jgi:hypothetical protein
MDRGALRPCGIVTGDVHASPASVRSTINQAAEASCQKRPSPMIERSISHLLSFAY